MNQRRGLLAKSLIIITIISNSFEAKSQSRHQRKASELAESEKSLASGGATFNRDRSVDQTFEDLLNWLKQEGYSLTSASKESGQIVTEIRVSGGYRQTGTRMVLTVFKDVTGQTTVRAAVTEQKRFKAIQTEPWGEPKTNLEKSQALVERLKVGLK
jgi:hypothetical protein